MELFNEGLEGIKKENETKTRMLEEIDTRIEQMEKSQKEKNVTSS